MTLGSKIADLRKENKITQKELAQKLNVSDKVVSRWETGVFLPDVEMVKKLATVFNVTIAELYDALEDVDGNADERDNYERIWQYYDYDRIWKYKRSTIIASSLWVVSALVWIILMALVTYDVLPDVYPYTARYVITGILISAMIVLDCVSVVWQIVCSVSMHTFGNTKYYRVLYSDALKRNIRNYLITFGACVAFALIVTLIMFVTAL